MAHEVELWFEFASTYSYPATARVSALAAMLGVTIVWRPFLLGPIFKDMGWNDSPFNLYPAKGRYMWRDLERTCAKYRLPFRRPSAFPRNGLLAARVATIAAEEGWAAEFVPAVYHANFVEDRDVGDPEVVAAIVRSQGHEPTRVLDAAHTSLVKDRLRVATEQAVRRGIFGAPSFVVNGELFWGNDRLEDALAWASRRA